MVAFSVYSENKKQIKVPTTAVTQPIKVCRLLLAVIIFTTTCLAGNWVGWTAAQHVKLTLRGKVVSQDFLVTTNCSHDPIQCLQYGHASSNLLFSKHGMFLTHKLKLNPAYPISPYGCWKKAKKLGYVSYSDEVTYKYFSIQTMHHLFQTLPQTCLVHNHICIQAKDNSSKHYNCYYCSIPCIYAWNIHSLRSYWILTNLQDTDLKFKSTDNLRSFTQSTRYTLFHVWP